MAYTPEPTTLVTTGIMPFLVLASAALTAPVSLFLLKLYRRAVVRSMAQEGGRHERTANLASAPSASPPTSDLQLIEAAAADVEAAPPTYRSAVRSLHLATLVYVLAGLAYAALLTAAWVTFTRVDGVPVTRVMWLMSCYAWPTALAVALIAAVGHAQRLLVALAYFTMLFAVAGYAVARNASLNAEQIAFFWLYTNAPATVLLLLFLRRRVRAVGPLVLAFMVCAVTGSQVVLSAVGASDDRLRVAAALGEQLGLSGTGTFFALIFVGFLLFGLLGWLVLRWLARRYERRRTSDQALTLDAMWLMFGVVQSITLAFEGWWWIFTGLVAFAAYKAVAAIGFAWTGLGRRGHAAPMLLLLRVFALGNRSERLFDAFSKRWLRAGSIAMIAGPDLVAATVAPHEFLEFLGGRLTRRFVRGNDDLRARAAAMARGPDPDGRYRVNEFFCYADTWQETMRTLARQADAVLMDLRSFSRANQGCQYELQQLVDTALLERVVLLVDATTDRALLVQQLRNAWRCVHADSPNRSTVTPRVRVVSASSERATDVNELVQALAMPAAAGATAGLHAVPLAS